jgi:hypothetical protein
VRLTFKRYSTTNQGVMIAATMGSSTLGVLFFFVIAGIAFAIVRRGQTEKRRRDVGLARLSPTVSGTVSSKDGRLRGTYRGYAVEAWAAQVEPGPSSEHTPTFVDVFFLQLGGVAGREAWQCASWPRLKPFAPPEFKFDFGGPPLLPGFGKIVDISDHDPALEERLRAAGLTEAIESLGRESNPFLPEARYMPVWRWQNPAQLRDVAAQLPALAASPHETKGALMCEVEMRGGPVPSPERFRELLDHAVRIAQINAEANPAESGTNTPRDS